MKKTFPLMLIILVLFIGNIRAQDVFDEFARKSKQEFNDFKGKSIQEFNDFRDKANAEFAAFMGRPWSPHKVSPAIPIPQKPDPDIVPVKRPTPQQDQRSPLKIPYKNIIPAPKPQPSPVPIAPIVIPESAPIISTIDFNYYGTKCSVHWTDNLKFSLSGIQEKEIAKTWSRLSGAEYNPVLSDFLVLKEKLRLCDWGYIQLIKKFTESIYHSTTSNEGAVLQMFILTQSGYKVRMARADNRIIVLIPSNYVIYQYEYLSINGLSYYVFDSSLKNAKFFVFDCNYPKEQLLSIEMKEEPLLAFNGTKDRLLFSKGYPNVKAYVKTNKNLIDFYNDYPLNSNWDLYSEASLSEEAKENLYPVLKREISGKSEATAANILLNFVQTSLNYKTDQDQFGCERPLFADETIYYPYCDCEDRAILYSILVKDLLHLKVVLLHYPGHLATAVHFNENINGDYLSIDNIKYIVCDPTYINAPIGDAMPEFKHSNCNVVKLSSNQ